MSQTLITNLIYVLTFVGGLVLEHYGIIPVASTNYIVGAIAGHAVASGTLSPSTAVTKAGKAATLPRTPDHD